MSLTPSISRRALKHTRAIHIEAFVRDDGLWELDAHLTDTKPFDLTLPAGNLPAGAPLHSLWLRLTLDRQFTIVEVEANSEAVPYQGYCNTINPAYKTLVGLSLVKGFRYMLKERIGGALGCTHLTELAQILPTAALQAFGGEIDRGADAAAGQGKPPQLDRCHALRSEGAVVAQYYPKWAISPPAEVDQQTHLSNQAISFN
ncbi:Protein of unknown function (DUF2889) [Collimonas sp. PA-H2]|uniref:DUF2889 domain-containing protein n=1 Tax=Collimonas sp. PA-H2 TaxID=1881062 RepID=UPI000BF6DE71|nr:DUF2889 domain-containing protein [Collimonas sp. PA-H2]PFH09019.1 Protein of unknown function (DUF2889) [Collimonas sp. PA-H2]